MQRLTSGPGQVNFFGIREAPQGGFYVSVDNKEHYVAHGHEPTVSKGSIIEAGDAISTGVPNPSEIVHHKGIGEGKRYFVDAFRKAYQDSGITHHRRNIELLARGLINHVELHDEVGPYAPGEIIPYHVLAGNYEPRSGHKLRAPKDALNHYLETPILHYSIGTKITPSVVKTLGEFGLPAIDVHHEPPPFTPTMVRGLETVSSDPDWLVRFLGSYLKKNFLRGVHRGHKSDENSTSYVPSLARAVDFGKYPPLQSFTPPGGTPQAPMPHPSIAKQMFLCGHLPMACLTTRYWVSRAWTLADTGTARTICNNTLSGVAIPPNSSPLGCRRRPRSFTVDRGRLKGTEIKTTMGLTAMSPVLKKGVL